jgi:hypothetical protein
MCGIAGFNLTEKPSAEFVLSLGQAMISRGEDSYGFFSPEAGIKKDIGPITKGIRAADMLAPSAFLHTRHATTGKVTAENAHPFQIGDIVFAHNGIVWHNVDLNKQFNRECSVDSQHIAYHIIEGKPLTDLEGYGAIQFYQNGQWFIGACNFGDLECARIKGRGLVWASTQEAIKIAAFQAGYEIEHFFEVEQGKVYRAAIDTLYETDRTFQLTKHVYEPVKSTGTYGGEYMGNYQDSDYWRKVWHMAGGEKFESDTRKGLDDTSTETAFHSSISTEEWREKYSDDGEEIALETIEGVCEWCHEHCVLDIEASDEYGTDLCGACAKLLA